MSSEIGVILKLRPFKFEAMDREIEKQDWYGTGNTVGHAPEAN